ncbi:unnamed protein product [Protopolystoma xenopodis]|uniref:Uncharacterized protein n=1 Tax=Protopolystoma xenopodis TaxID=117903 RepID=A0A3S5FE98_9PLAT|nr:unnamed protein product [Protopolystoma xenopodis]
MSPFQIALASNRLLHLLSGLEGAECGDNGKSSQNQSLCSISCVHTRRQGECRQVVIACDTSASVKVRKYHRQKHTRDSWPVGCSSSPQQTSLLALEPKAANPAGIGAGKLGRKGSKPLWRLPPRLDTICRFFAIVLFIRRIFHHPHSLAFVLTLNFALTFVLDLTSSHLHPFKHSSPKQIRRQKQMGTRPSEAAKPVASLAAAPLDSLGRGEHLHVAGRKSKPAQLTFGMTTAPKSELL